MKSAALLPFALVWNLSTSALANDGVLPRGRAEAPGKKLAPPPPETSPVFDCTQILSNPESGELYFTADGLKLYFLSHDSQALAEGKTFLYEVDLANFRYKRIVSLKTGEAPALVGHGNPLEAITVFDFRKGRPACGEGLSAGIGIKWTGNRKIIKSYPPAGYKIIPSDQGLQVAEMDTRTVKQLDMQSYQKRTVTLFNAKVIPLFLRVQPLQLFAFQTEQDELQRFDDASGEAKAVLKLKKGMKLLQQGEQFGTIATDETGKTLMIKQIKGWSGQAFRGYDLKLPDPWMADRASVQIDFRSGTVAVQGNQKVQRRELQQVLIYEAVKEQLERTLKAPEGQYFSHTQFSPTGKHLVVLARDLAHEMVQSLRVLQVGEGEWRELPLQQREFSAPLHDEPSKIPAKSGDKSVPPPEVQKPSP
jgi:hypothetical protein